MRALLVSPAFLPNVGGLEICVAQQAEGLAARGHEVVVVTRTPGGEEPGPYRVVRRPGAGEFLRLTRWCQVFVQANVSLKELWPLALVRRPWVVSHHSWYGQPGAARTLPDRLKRRLLRHATASIAVSRALADDLGPGTLVIENGYRDRLFRRLPGVARSRELLCVGRLVSDKGVDLLLDALARLAADGVRPRLSIVGDGPEREALEAQTQRLGLAGQVEFLGTRSGEDLVRSMNEHEILVVPSRYAEPFGIVALEGLACGLLVVGSRGGGLADAIGACGLVFPNGDAAALSAQIARLLRDPALRDQLRSGAAGHLEAHTAESVSARYAEVVESAARG